MYIYTMDYFIINNKYYLISETRYYDDNSPRYIQLYFGGNKVQCINIDIPGSDSSIGFFHTVVFDKWCDIDKNLTNGEPLRVLINTALNYVKIKYPHIKHLKLDDMSNRVCVYGEKLAVSLFHFHIVFSGGQTWYEKYFGATKLDKHFWDKYQNSIIVVFITILGWYATQTPIHITSIYRIWLDCLRRWGRRWGKFLH